MNHKQWIGFILFISFIIFSTVGLFNYYIDPLWTFSHSNKYNNVQTDFNVRIQKMNRLYFNDSSKYDGILLGSSRTTYINQYDFKGMNIFNMAAANMFPREYDGYIDVLQKLKGGKLKYIILGIDFFGTRVPEKEVYHKKAYHYLSESKSFFYRYKHLFSNNLLRYSLRDVMNNYRKPIEYYDRNNVRYHLKVTGKELSKHVEITFNGNMNKFRNIYKYNSNYRKILENLKDKYKDSKFIIFTTPATSKLLYATLTDAKKFNEYSRWLHDLVNVFGKVYHFYDFNTITNNLNYYVDDEHFYPYVGTMIVSKLINKKLIESPKNFGIVLTKDNVDDYLKKFKKILESKNDK